MDNDKINIDVYSKEDIEKFFYYQKNTIFLVWIEQQSLRLYYTRKRRFKNKKTKMIAFVIRLKDRIVKGLSITPNYLKLTEMKRVL